jgi:hypothetical protein
MHQYILFISARGRLEIRLVLHLSRSKFVRKRGLLKSEIREEAPDPCAPERSFFQHSGRKGHVGGHVRISISGLDV